MASAYAASMRCQYARVSHSEGRLRQRDIPAVLQVQMALNDGAALLQSVDVKLSTRLM